MLYDDAEPAEELKPLIAGELKGGATRIDERKLLAKARSQWLNTEPIAKEAAPIESLEKIPVFAADDVALYLDALGTGLDVSDVVGTMAPPFDEFFIEFQRVPNQLDMRAWGAHIEAISDEGRIREIHPADNGYPRMIAGLKRKKSVVSIVLRHYSYRFAEQVLNSKLSLKQECEQILTDPTLSISTLSRPVFNQELDKRFVAAGWESQPAVFGEPDQPMARMDFLKDRIGVEVEFGHSSFIGIDMLKFQIGSYSELDKIDVGIYVVTTNKFQKRMTNEVGKNWSGGSLSFEKVCKYLPYFKSAIQVPIYVIGIDLV